MKYDFKLNMAVENNSHTQLVKRVPKGSKVLELGCATGYMSQVLHQLLECRVVGVELDAQAAEQAAHHCDRVIQADVERLDWLQQLNGERFDVVTCADIIEHLKEPDRVLSALHGCLKPEGILLASIPNAAHASIRLELLEGRLTYEETGLLDSTHLHLYTQASLRALFAGSGYQIDELSYTFHDLSDEVIQERLSRLGLTPSARTLHLLHAPEAAAFQYIIQAHAPRAGERLVEPPELTDKPLQDSLEVYRNLLRRLDEVQRLAHDRAMVIEGLQNLHVETVKLRGQRDKSRAVNRRLTEELARHRESLQSVLNSRGWRLWLLLTLPLRAWRRLRPTVVYYLRRPRQGAKLLRDLGESWRRGGRAAMQHRHRELKGRFDEALDADYQAWIDAHGVMSDTEMQEMRLFIQGLSRPPLISLIMPVYNVDPKWLSRAMDSVLAQSWPHWELCVADDASTDPAIHQLLRRYARMDSRIKVVFRDDNGHISAASNSALALAGGDYIALLDQDDLLPFHALYHVARELVAHPDTLLLYSDEDKIDAAGRRFAHYFKPDFNPDLMLSHNMICHLGVYHRRLVKELGGFREGYEGAQDYDLALRLLAREGTERVRHIPRILYHWRLLPESTASSANAKPYAVAAAIRAVSDYLARRGETAEVTESPLIEGMLRVKYTLPDPAPLVSIIIPTKNGLELLQRCIGSLVDKTDYPRFEILVVDNDSDDAATLDYLKKREQAGDIRLLPYPRPFNFSAINNLAVAQCQGEVLAFMNNDMEVISPDWLSEMVGHALRAEIGAVGARLWYPDNRLQHGGVVLGLGGVAGHAMKYLAHDDKGYNARAVLVQNYSAVTAACMVVRRRVFDEVEGFDEVNLAVAFNDVDFCLRLLERGYRNLWTPYAELYHHESASRGPEDTIEKQVRFAREIDYMKRRWKELLELDPAYNPNLTHKCENFALELATDP